MGVLEIERKSLEQLIIKNEWEMFQQVHGIGGRAPCQEDEQYTTFVIMRLSQFESWPLEVVRSYLQDLEDAKSIERNLFMEKYAWMMEETDPDYFIQIRHLLPSVSDECKELAEKITTQYLFWEKEVNNLYPKIRKNGRPTTAAISLEGDTSLETYLRCELMTYSTKTLHLLWEEISRTPHQNLYMVSMEKLVSAYGYHSLREAEEALD